MRPSAKVTSEAKLKLSVEVEQEQDGRWLAEVPQLPGVLAYGSSKEQSIARAKALALRVIADRLERGEPVPEMAGVFTGVA